MPIHLASAASSRAMGFLGLVTCALGCGDGLDAVSVASESDPHAQVVEPNGVAAEPQVRGEGAAQGGAVTANGAAASAMPSRREPQRVEAGQTSRWVFDDAELRTYELTLGAAEWERLQLDARDEEYVPADLRVGDISLARVGLRFKGSVGTLIGCFDDQGRQTCSKLSMKLKFDEYEPEQRLLGLKRLNFHSMVLDPSQLRERLSYRLFAEMGVAAPRAAHARLVVNGELLGLFSLVEDVDGRFTKDRFEGGDGNLYKEQWPNTQDPVKLGAGLETNEEAADHSVLQRFSAELLAASRAELPEVVARYMDLDDLVTYLAVDRSIINWDGVTAFHCYGSPCENHNYYLYQHETAPAFTLIPWDLDNTFQLDSPLAAVPGPFEVPADCTLRYPAFGRGVMAPGCDPLLQAVALSGSERIVEAFDRWLDGPFELATMEAWLGAWQAQIEPAVAEDDNGPGLTDFRAAAERLRGILVTARERAIAERNGLAAAPR